MRAMPDAKQTFDACGPRVGIRRPAPSDREEFLALAQESRAFLSPWIDSPDTDERFDAYLRRAESENEYPALVCDAESRRIVGVINVSCIVRGFFQSAYVGFWIGAPFARRGYMGEALPLLVRYVFEELGLHRLEANIQPGNAASIALVRRCGFNKEGFSPKYLQVFGEWRDHERWAIRAD
jgi:ribosomal-protein-alanine N-acetyltransferase